MKEEKKEPFDFSNLRSETPLIIRNCNNFYDDLFYILMSKNEREVRLRALKNADQLLFSYRYSIYLRLLNVENFEFFFRTYSIEKSDGKLINYIFKQIKEKETERDIFLIYKHLISYEYIHNILYDEETSNNIEEIFSSLLSENEKYLINLIIFFHRDNEFKTVDRTVKILYLLIKYFKLLDIAKYNIKTTEEYFLLLIELAIILNIQIPKFHFFLKKRGLDTYEKLKLNIPLFTSSLLKKNFSFKIDSEEKVRENILEYFDFLVVQNRAIENFLYINGKNILTDEDLNEKVNKITTSSTEKIKENFSNK